MKLLTLITHSMPQSQLFQQANMSPAFILTLTSCSVSSPPPSHAELLLQHDPWQANPQKWTWANWSKQPRSVTYDCQVHFLRFEIRIFVQLHSLASGLWPQDSVQLSPPRNSKKLPCLNILCYETWCDPRRSPFLCCYGWCFPEEKMGDPPSSWNITN